MSHLTAIIYKEKYFKINLNFKIFLFSYFIKRLTSIKRYLDKIIINYILGKKSFMAKEKPKTIIEWLSGFSKEIINLDLNN